MLSKRKFQAPAWLARRKNSLYFPVLAAALIVVAFAGYQALVIILPEKPTDTSQPREEKTFLTGDNVTEQSTFTQKYLAGLPEDAAREDILDHVRLESFVAMHQGDLLPDIDLESVKTITGNPESLDSYLKNISAGHNDNLYAIDNYDIDEAFAYQLSLRPELMSEIVEKLEHNITVLKNTPAPTDKVGLHIKIIAANQSLLENTKLLKNIDDDFVGGLIGAHNIARLGPVFYEISEEIKKLN